MYIGIDVGSTTVKAVCMNENNEIVYKKYERHYSKTKEKCLEILKEIKELIPQKNVCIAITGSAGLNLSKELNINFVQEVFATSVAIENYRDDIDVAIELGGEDAKILFLTGGVEERMNGACAGGTGAFIDQMATLLNVDAKTLDEMSFNADKEYTIASRCGVFGKTDIQILLNEGVKKENISRSIYKAVVEQTVAGLAQGRDIKGKVIFLGGPLTFLKGLQRQFVSMLGIEEENVILPVNSQYFVALGCSHLAKDFESVDIDEVINSFAKKREGFTSIETLEPLFGDEEEYKKFKDRHANSRVEYEDINKYSGNAYLGIDGGSTTTKLVLISEDDKILYEFYSRNNGNPVELLKKELMNLLELCGDRITIQSGVVTGYGEELLKNAFKIEHGIVETVAHYTAAKYFNKDVDFIIDIGGQDIKCFKIVNGAIDSIMLNEACSSGCGSFIETFANAWGKTSEEFSELALFAKQPVNLGTRCTVFMNSSVKQAQNEGATMEDISAGLAISVVKNSLYKVIRASSKDEFGENIVVQGGTFYNDAILRSFEMETERYVTRPSIAGLMGAFGAALYAKTTKNKKSGIISLAELKDFVHDVKNAKCKMCTNNCSFTINTFSTGAKFIAGNKCEKPIKKEGYKLLPNMFEKKLNYLLSLKSVKGKRGKIGIPLVLNMYEMLPFWHKIFTDLDFEVVISGISNREMYSKGQYTIPSDTVCYPAKLVHGHIEKLMDMNIDKIFYPCLPYNFKEGDTDNHYNCPVVAYYPELIRSNMSKINHIDYYNDYYGIHNKKFFTKRMAEFLNKEFDIPKSLAVNAIHNGYKAYEDYYSFIKEEGQKALKYAEDNELPVIVLAGRPYHIDPEISHSIDKLLNTFGFVVVSEDAVSHKDKIEKTSVLNQWTYHARLYNSANYVTTRDNMQMVQLVSFGCGVDAITTDEVRSILESKGKFYTQLKIDEINNLGAAKIRIRSLMAAIEQRVKDDE